MFESTNRKRETNEIQLKAAGSVRLWSRSIARLDLVWPKVLVENRHKTLCAWLVFDVSISTILCTVQLICVLPLLWHAIIVCVKLLSRNNVTSDLKADTYNLCIQCFWLPLCASLVMLSLQLLSDHMWLILSSGYWMISLPRKEEKDKKKLYCSFFIVGARSALCITAADYWTVISTLNLTGCWRHTSNKLTEKDRFTRNKQDKEPHLYLFYQFSLQIKVTFYITVKQ